MRDCDVKSCWCLTLGESRTGGKPSTWICVDNSNHIARLPLSIYICSLLLSKPKNIMSTNNSEGNEINEGYNCVWNCNYCYHSLLSLGFSVSRCANGNDCHCFSGLDQPHFRPPTLSTCNYWFLLTNHSWCWELTGSLRRNSPEMIHVASRHVHWLWRRDQDNLTVEEQSPFFDFAHLPRK